MFPFASILTEVPLIIMAAAYMIYFGACTLNKSYGKQNDVTLEVNKEITYNKNVISADKEVFYYDNYFFPDKNVTSVSYNGEENYKPFITSYFYIRDKIVSSQTLAFHLFSRPPPVS